MRFMTYMEAETVMDNLLSGKDSVIKIQWDSGNDDPQKYSQKYLTESTAKRIREKFEIGGHIRFFTKNNYQIVVFSDVGEFDYIREIRKGGRVCHKRDVEKLDEKYCDVKYAPSIRQVFYIPGYLRSMTEEEIQRVQELLKP